MIATLLSVSPDSRPTLIVMQPADHEQPTAVFTTPVPRPRTRRPRKIWLIAAIAAAVVAAVSAVAMAFTMPSDRHQTPTEVHSDAGTRRDWAHKYGVDRQTGTDLPDVAAATDEQRKAAADLLSRTKAATAGLTDLNAAKAAGFDVAAQVAESEQHNSKIAAHIAEIDAHGPGRRPLTLTVLNKSNTKDVSVLDPTAPQALLYAYRGNGAWQVIGARFMADKLWPAAPPTPGGPITRWAYDKSDHLTMRIYFVPGDDLQQTYALRRPGM